MLDFAKSILCRVSFNDYLFNKELNKLICWMGDNEVEINKLKNWCKENIKKQEKTLEVNNHVNNLY